MRVCLCVYVSHIVHALCTCVYDVCKCSVYVCMHCMCLCVCVCVHVYACMLLFHIQLLQIAT